VPLAGGTPQPVGRLPAPSSDQAAAAVGSTAYVVGGYTGSRWLDTIVAWRPGSTARVVAHLPTAIRYAAVAATGGALVVAGGSLPDGTASDAVYSFTPSNGRVKRIARLPHPLTHAAAASLGGAVYLLGGRGASTGTQTDAVLRIDPVTGSVRAVLRLPAPLSDLAAVRVGSRILIAGGRTARGTVASILTLGLRAKPVEHRASIPTPLSRSNVYAADAAGMLSPVAARALPRIYVPNSLSGTVDVIDPHTFRVVGHFAVGALPQHVTPSWDLRTLYVLNDQGNSVTPIDPNTARPGAPIPVDDPYNMYFTPDGRFAIVVAERLQRLDFRAAQTLKLVHSLPVACPGVDHMDFSADGSYAIASCEFSGELLKLDVAHQSILGKLTLPDGSAGMPQDVKLSPDGKVFYVADQRANGLWKVDGDTFKVTGFVHTGAGVHGLYPSRDARFLYATNRGEGSVSVLSFRSEKVVATWRIPGGGSPDMGGVSADGRVLWLSGRYSGVVYALSTRTGKLLARIRVGNGPHGLCVWPQPGRYSLGHTGILR
jgi:DNA-binding beta-propeller fold protein YncE